MNWIGKTPILYIHPSANNYTSFSNIIKEPYVIEIGVPCEEKTYYENGLDYSMGRMQIIKNSTSEPNKYLKPLDIVKIKKSTLGNEYYHFGIYLGNEKVCHVTDPYSKSKDTRDTNRVVITDWEDFIKGWWCKGNPEVTKIHPLIPFRRYREIAKNIAWDEYDRHIEGRYCLANNNCEHYANYRVFGLNWSEQVAARPSRASEYARYVGTNNGKSSFNLKDELERNFSKLDNWRSQEIERNYLQEVPPKQNCRIM